MNIQKILFSGILLCISFGILADFNPICVRNSTGEVLGFKVQGKHPEDVVKSAGFGIKLGPNYQNKDLEVYRCQRFTYDLSTWHCDQKFGTIPSGFIREGFYVAVQGARDNPVFALDQNATCNEPWDYFN
jgi:hypothetical protein